MAFLSFVNKRAFHTNNPVKVRSIGRMEDYRSVDEFNKDYLAMREEQDAWIEYEYDLSTKSGIEAIPQDCFDAPGSSPMSSTGTTAMYLRKKGFGYEEQGNEILALACLKKSNEIRFYKKRGHRKDDYYSYVRMLVHFGHVDVARKEKERIDKFFGDYIDDTRSLKWKKWNNEEYLQLKKNWDELIDFEIGRANKYREYTFVAEHFPDLCPKSQGAYTRAKNTNSKRYQQIIQEMKARGLDFPEPLR